MEEIYPEIVRVCMDIWFVRNAMQWAAGAITLAFGIRLSKPLKFDD